MIEQGVVTRADLFVTSKLWCTFFSSEERVKKCLADTLKNLDLEYLDLYLVHWPVCFKDDDTEAIPFDEATMCQDPPVFRAMINDKVSPLDVWTHLSKVHTDLKDEAGSKKVRSIGVSNFNEAQIKALVDDTATVCPAMNQIEIHAYQDCKQLVKACQNSGVAVTAYTPLGNPQRMGKEDQLDYPVLMEDPLVASIAKAHNKTPAQVLLRWIHQRPEEIVVIPKSITLSRIEENSEIFDFELTDDEFGQVSAINKDLRMVPCNIIKHSKNYPW